MAQYQTEAILLTVRDWGEADRVATLFSREYGKLVAMAYGARYPKSKLAGCMQPFIHLDAAILSGKSMDSIKQCEVKNSFRKAREDLHCMAYGAFIAEITTELCPERQAEPLIFDLLLDIFRVIIERNPRLVALAGAWQLLSLCGYYPEYANCTICGKNITFPAHFDAGAGGAVCTLCHHHKCHEFGQAECDLIKRLLHLNWKNPEHFTVNKATLLQTENILINYLVHCLDKPLKSIEFIKQLSVI